MKNFLLPAVFASAVALSAAAEPSFEFLVNGPYLPASRGMKLPVESEGVTNIEIIVKKAYDNNIALYGVGESYYEYDRMREIARRQVQLPPPYDKAVTRMLDIGSIIGDVRPGLYNVYVETDAKRRRWSWSDDMMTVTASRMIALTDLGVSAAVDGTGERAAYVGVCNLSTGRPVEGADVAILTRANQVAGSGVTGENGAVRIEFSPEYDAKGDRPSGVLVTTGGDISYLEVGSRWGQTADSVRAADPTTFSEPRAFVFAGRDIVRPGERFDASVLVRNSPVSGLGVLAGAPVDLVLNDAKGDRFGSVRLTTDENGFASTSWEIPASAPTGLWLVRCKVGDDTVGSMNFNVSAYTPDRIRATLSAGKDTIVGLGVANTLTANAQYYFGAPVTDGTYKLTGSSSPASTLPAHWEGWTVGCDDWSKYDEIPLASGSLDGEKVVCTDPGLAEDINCHIPISTAYRFEVTPPSGRTVTAWSRVVTFPTDRFIGVREGSAFPGERARVFDMRLLSVESPAEASAPFTAAGGMTVEVKLEKKEWRHHYVKNGSSVRVEWVEESIAHPELSKVVSVPAGADLNSWSQRLVWSEEDLSSGCWRMTLSSSDGKLVTEKEFWHWKGDVSERSQSPASLMLESDSSSYLPGSRAAVTFRTGFSGRAYIAAGWKGLEETFSMKVEKGLNTIPLQIPADIKGAAYYVTVTLVTENAPKMKRLSGIARLEIDQSAVHRLKVGLAVPEKVEPGKPLDVAVTLFDAAGGLASGMVQILATDEGVLSLTGFESPDPYEHFYGFAYGLPYGTFDFYSLVYPELEILPNGEIGGDTLLASRLRKDGKTKARASVALVSAPVKVGPDGSATVRLDVPEDFSGELRVMAVASSPEAVGSKSRPVKVRSKIGVETLAPHFAAPGDSFNVKATLFNHDLPAGAYRCTMKCGSKAETFEGVLENGAQCTVELPVKLPGDFIGEMKVDAEFEMGGTVMHSSDTFVARPPRPAVEEVYYFLLAPGENPPLPALDRDWIDGEERIEEFTSPVATLSGAMDWLEGYPYGCLEQTAARAFPFLAAREIEALGLAKGTNILEEAAKRMEVAYANILSMKQYDGSYSMWPNGDDTWTEGTLFAKHLFAEAVAAGMLPQSAVERSDTWLKRIANRGGSAARANAAYATYILAVMGDESFLQPARNILASKESDRARFLAAAALVRGGYAAEGEAILAESLRSGAWRMGEYGGKARAAGFALYIAAKAGSRGEDLAPIVSALNLMVRKDSSAWGTTSDNAWAALGLATAGVRLPKEAVRLVKVVRTGVERNPATKNWPISVRRIYRNQNGDIVTSARKGDLLTAEISCNSTADIENAVICDLLPGGLEIEDSSLKTRATSSAGESKGGVTPWGHSEIRDDRWIWFGSLYSGTNYTLKYKVRAVTSGSFAVADVTVEDMYDPDMKGVSSTETRFSVE